MKKILLGFLLLSLCSNAQKYKRGIEYKLNIEKLEASNEIVWYGWDFSKLRITDPKQYAKSEEVKNKHIPAIIGLLNEQFSLKWMARKLKKEKFSSSLNEIQKSFSQVNENNLVSFEKFELNLDSIKAITKAYNLTKKEGVGFVVIMENFNKQKRYVTSYPTFFDLATGEVLYTTRMKGKPGSKYGYAKYWEEGILETIYYFFKKYY